jgi:general stress protein 26
MTDLDRVRNAPEDTLWTELEAVEAGMLGISGSGQHMQPMAHFVDTESNRLWFLTTRGTDLAKALQPDSTAHFVIISENHDFYACMSGPISEMEDAPIKDALWQTTAADHYVDGKDDPALMMIALELSDAALWALSKGESHHRWQSGSEDAGDETGVRNHVTFG